MLSLLDNMLLLQGVLVLGIVAAGVVLRGPGSGLFARLARALDGLARRPRAAITVCAAAGFIGSALVAWLAFWPEPNVHDEFSYLLVADTLAEGRLANPPHPLWEFFESIHVLQQPSYASKYPPGIGVALFSGRLLFGHPLAGMWLTAALLCGAICWMLQGWLPRRWALLGGLWATAQFGIATYWTQSYWGGALAAAGGALVFGALPRILRRPCLGDGALLGAGLVVLAVTRPFEGMVTTLPAGLHVLGWLIGHRGSALRDRVLTAATTAVVLAGGFVWIGLYNHAVTGSAFRMPYQVHDEQYAVVPPLLLLEKGPVPEYRHEALRSYWTESTTYTGYDEQQSLAGFLEAARVKAVGLWWFYVGPLSTLALLALPWVLRQRLRGFALASIGLLFLALLLETYDMRHYAAPATGLIVVLVMSSMRRFATWGRARGRIGRSIVLGLFLAHFALTAAQAATRGHEPESWFLRRAEIQHELEADDARHLIVVTYGPQHHTANEWVYNAADIDEAEVVWARDMGAENNRRLLDHFPDREIWSLHVDLDDTKVPLVPYEE